MPIEITLPWKNPDGPEGDAPPDLQQYRWRNYRRSKFNVQEWERALTAAGLIPERESGERYASAQQHGMHALRHFYAPALLDAGKNSRAVSEYLGYADPALTLWVYTH